MRSTRRKMHAHRVERNRKLLANFIVLWEFKGELPTGFTSPPLWLSARFLWSHIGTIEKISIVRHASLRWEAGCNLFPFQLPFKAGKIRLPQRGDEKEIIFLGLIYGHDSTDTAFKIEVDRSHVDSNYTAHIYISTFVISANCDLVYLLLKLWTA